MNKFFLFLMVGMAFTTLQVATAEANEMECVNAGTPSQVADCWKAKAQDGSMKHSQKQHDGSNGQYDTTHQGQEQEAKKGHYYSGGQQHYDGAQGEHHGTSAPQGFSGEQVAYDAAPIDPRSGQPFTQADEAKFTKYADECEATKGLLSEGSTQELVKEGFTRLQVEKLCKDGPE
jgi:hypothetical protein